MWIYFTRSELLVEGEVIGERGRFPTVGGGGGGGGGATFFGIFLRVLIKPVGIVLFDEVTLGEGSRFIGTFEGDLIVDVGSILTGTFCGGLLGNTCTGFFIVTGVFALDGDGIGSFFLILKVVDGCVEGFISVSDFILGDGRGFDNKDSE